MVETWIDGSDRLVSLGFTGDDRETVIYVPLDDFGLTAANLQRRYKSKAIIQWQHTGKLVAVSVPVIESDRRPWGCFTVTKSVTAHSGLVVLQIRSVNYYFRLLTSKSYRGIIFDKV